MWFLSTDFKSHLPQHGSPPPRRNVAGCHSTCRWCAAQGARPPDRASGGGENADASPHLLLPDHRQRHDWPQRLANRVRACSQGGASHAGAGPSQAGDRRPRQPNGLDDDACAHRPRRVRLARKHPSGSLCTRGNRGQTISWAAVRPDGPAPASPPPMVKVMEPVDAVMLDLELDAALNSTLDSTPPLPPPPSPLVYTPAGNKAPVSSLHLQLPDAAPISAGGGPPKASSLLHHHALRQLES